MLQTGTKAPEFTLPDQNGELHGLKDYRGKRVLLYFYPRDNTPGCTKQALSAIILIPRRYSSAGIPYLQSPWEERIFPQEAYSRLSGLLQSGCLNCRRIPWFIRDTENPQPLAMRKSTIRSFRTGRKTAEKQFQRKISVRIMQNDRNFIK